MTIEISDIRPEVLAFAKALEEKLRAKVDTDKLKRSNKTQLTGALLRSVARLLAALDYDRDEIQETLRIVISRLDYHDFTSDPRGELIDVANFAMMLFENLSSSRGG